MRRLISCLCLLALGVQVGPVVVYGAGDASAIRRATHTSDSRYVSNYRPGTMQASSRQRHQSGLFGAASGHGGVSRATVAALRSQDFDWRHDPLM